MTGRLLGSGRAADVYEIDEAWVLRRNREGWGDALAEGAVMEHVRRHGYPAPRVRLSASTRTDLVMERLSGPTMLEALGSGRTDARESLCHISGRISARRLVRAIARRRSALVAEPRGRFGNAASVRARRRAPGRGCDTGSQAGDVLAGLLRRLHAIPARHPSTRRVLHLDLHPDNVILTPDGPYVIDWTNTEEGDPGLDWGMSAVILAQVAVSAEALAGTARALLAALLADASDLTGEGLAEARRRRAANPTMSRREVELLGDAEELVRAYVG
ncbi:phosphotransferase enzyme family protein [Streptomyces sp. SA15]|uniref:phosphotransferase family protein n=1 Tax=Streptomyces sp. SA15 TaxID=934019 RepID=UPI000BB06F4B|nr:aminoglycoside phosphotransferase family protein [Streptomyces sp. SA15]PAZ13140.1 phosphotransferase enzyme family protein [Streptomyces sp. SA15]